MTDAKDEIVNQRFKEWQRCRANLRGDALNRLAHGPAEAAASDMVALHRECDDSFLMLLEAMNDRTLARQNRMRKADRQG